MTLATAPKAAPKGRLKTTASPGLHAPGTKSLRTVVYDRIKKAVAAGDLGTNDVVTERELATLMGVSRTPVREALSLLVHDGLLDQTGRGFMLAQITGQDIAQIFEVRRMLEPQAVAMCINHLSNHDFAMMADAIDQQRKAHLSDNTERFAEANDRFRQIWIAHVPNLHLRTTMERYNDHVSWLRQVTLANPATRRVVVERLQALLEALRAGDGERSAAIMTDHLTVAEATLHEKFGKTGTAVSHSA